MLNSLAIVISLSIRKGLEFCTPTSISGTFRAALSDWDVRSMSSPTTEGRTGRRDAGHFPRSTCTHWALGLAPLAVVLHKKTARQRERWWGCGRVGVCFCYTVASAVTLALDCSRSSYGSIPHFSKVFWAVGEFVQTRVKLISYGIMPLCQHGQLP